MVVESGNLGYRKVSFERSMSSTHPRLAAEFHPTLNGDLHPDFISAGTNLRIWWLCQVCGFEWRSYGHTRKKPEQPGCPACAGSVATRSYNFAVVHPELVGEFHPSLNGEVTLFDFTPSSMKRVWWLCQVCGFEWETQIRHRHAGKGCPSCRGSLSKSDLDDFPLLVKELHPKECGRTNFSLSERCWWLCSVCGFEWEAAIRNRKQGTGCPACVGQAVSSKNCLAVVYPDVAAEWHPTKNGGLTPNDVTAGSNKSVWWICIECGGEWKTMVCSRTGNKTNCSTCLGVGFSQSLPGTLYVLCGDTYGKIGISNQKSLAARLNHHRQKGLFGPLVARFDFVVGGDALRVETKVKRSLRENFERPDLPEGFTEAFPAESLDMVLGWIAELL